MVTEHQEAVALGQDDPFGFRDHSLGLAQRGLVDKVRQVCVPQGCRARERGFLLPPQLRFIRLMSSTAALRIGIS